MVILSRLAVGVCFGVSPIIIAAERGTLMKARSVETPGKVVDSPDDEPLQIEHFQINPPRLDSDLNFDQISAMMVPEDDYPDGQIRQVRREFTIRGPELPEEGHSSTSVNKKPLTMIMYMHGYTMSPFTQKYRPFSQLALQRGDIVAVYPAGLDDLKTREMTLEDWGAEVIEEHLENSRLATVRLAGHCEAMYKRFPQLEGREVHIVKKVPEGNRVQGDNVIASFGPDEGHGDIYWEVVLRNCTLQKRYFISQSYLFPMEAHYSWNIGSFQYNPKACTEKVEKTFDGEENKFKSCVERNLKQYVPFTGHDDVKFLKMLVEKVKAAYKGQIKSVYVVGESNGGMFLHHQFGNMPVAERFPIDGMLFEFGLPMREGRLDAIATAEKIVSDKLQDVELFKDYVVTYAHLGSSREDLGFVLHRAETQEEAEARARSMSRFWSDTFKADDKRIRVEGPVIFERAFDTADFFKWSIETIEYSTIDGKRFKSIGVEAIPIVYSSDKKLSIAQINRNRKFDWLPHRNLPHNDMKGVPLLHLHGRQDECIPVEPQKDEDIEKIGEGYFYEHARKLYYQYANLGRAADSATGRKPHEVVTRWSGYHGLRGIFLPHYAVDVSFQTAACNQHTFFEGSMRSSKMAMYFEIEKENSQQFFFTFRDIYVYVMRKSPLFLNNAFTLTLVNPTDPAQSITFTRDNLEDEFATHLFKSLDWSGNDSIILSSSFRPKLTFNVELLENSNDPRGKLLDDAAADEASNTKTAPNKLKNLLKIGNDSPFKYTPKRDLEGQDAATSPSRKKIKLDAPATTSTSASSSLSSNTKKPVVTPCCAEDLAKTMSENEDDDEDDDKEEVQNDAMGYRVNIGNFYCEAYDPIADDEAPILVCTYDGGHGELPTFKDEIAFRFWKEAEDRKKKIAEKNKNASVFSTIFRCRSRSNSRLPVATADSMLSNSRDGRDRGEPDTWCLGEKGLGEFV